MDRVRFEERVKQIQEDMNGLNELSEAGIGELIAAITGGNSDVLFDNLPQVVTDLGAQIQIDVPAQRFSTSGVIGDVPADSLLVPKVDNYHKVYFVLSRVDVTALRDRMQITGSDLSVVQQNVVVKDQTVASIVLRSSGASGVPPTPPPLGPNDIGYVEFCEVIYDTVTIVDNHNVAALWVFPGGGIALTPHGLSHLTTDPIPDAGLGGDPSGSTRGLMPLGSLLRVSRALQSLDSPTALFLTRVVNSNRDVTLDFKYTDAFKVVDDAGTKKFAMNFPPGPFSGSSGLPAQSNHTHSQEDYPIRVLNYHVKGTSVNSGDLGKLIDVPEFTVNTVLMTQVFWLPPGAASAGVPAVHCGWMNLSSGIAGAKGNIIEPKVVKVETGDAAFCKMNDETLAAMGAVSWTYDTTPHEPTSGELLLRIVGLR